MLAAVIRKKTRYGLLLKTSAGCSKPLFSTSERFIDKVISTINDVMNHEDRPVSYTVNIKDESVTKNVGGDNFEFNGPSSGTIINSTRTNTSGSLNARSTSPALNEIAELLSQINRISSMSDAAPNRLIAELEASLKDTSSSRTRISELWHQICSKLPDVVQLTANLTTILSKLPYSA